MPGPDYPYHEGSPAAFRANTNKDLGKVELKDVIDHHLKFLDTLADKQPILVGHSMGGLIVQKLIELEKGSLGICITAAPPKGISTTKWSFFKSNLPTVNPLKGIAFRRQQEMVSLQHSQYHESGRIRFSI